MKSLHGRKTDMKDAEWIAQLLRQGLLKASFIPNRTLRELIAEALLRNVSGNTIGYRRCLKERTLNSALWFSTS
nr:transposase [Cytobacillus firmus]